MSSKKAGLPSLNSASKNASLQPVKVQRYRAGQAPEGYVDPALESSDDEDENNQQGTSASARAGRTGINVSIGGQGYDEPPKMAYQVLNVEKMTLERQIEKSMLKGGEPVNDRRLQRLQANQTGDRRGGRGDTRSRHRRSSSDEEDAQKSEEEEGDEEEEAALRRRKAIRAKAEREEKEEEEELWGQGEEDEEDQDETSKRSKAKRDGEESESGSSEYTSGSEEESSDDGMAPRRKLMKPVFVPKSQRITIDETTRADAAAELAEHERLKAIEERKKESHQMLKEYVARQAAVEEVPDVDNLADVDDTDGLDEEAEFELWKLRELKRIKRDREELEAREAEKAEIERRRELTEEERVKEDMAYLAKKAEEEKANKMSGTVEKYHHKGAFFMDTDEAILKRSTNEATPDAVKDIKALPKIMQVRNFGRAGQTKYTTLKDQDTSQPSGWNDPATRHLQSKHRMGGSRGDDFKIAASLGGGFRGGDRGGRGGRGGFGGRGGGFGGREEFSQRREAGFDQRDRGGDRYDRDSSNRRRDDDRVRDRDYGRDYRDRERDSDRGSRSGGRPSSSSSYRDRDRDGGEDESSKRPRY